MAGEVEAYIEANRAYIEAGKRLAPLIRTIVSAARSLEHSPEYFFFSGLEAAVPTKTAHYNQHREAAVEWPSAGQLQKALVEWHLTYAAATEAWKSVPKSAQDSMKSPNSMGSNVRHSDR
jgi:hypothetical protein